SALVNLFRDDGKIGWPRPCVDRLLQDLADQLGAAQLDPGVGRELQRVEQILERIVGRERALGKVARHDGLQAVITQGKTVGGTLRQRLQQQLRIDAAVPRYRNRFGQCVDGLE